MTNHHESTQDQTPADSRKRPTRLQVAVDAVLLGIMAGVLVWLVLGQIERPTTWGRVGVIVYAVITGWHIWSLVRVLRRRWAPVLPVVAYADRDGDVWHIREDGYLALNPDRPGLALEEVQRDYGPLQPVYGSRS